MFFYICIWIVLNVDNEGVRGEKKGVEYFFEYSIVWVYLFYFGLIV